MSKKGIAEEHSKQRFKVFRVEILVLFAAFILIVTACLDYVILDRSGRAMKQKVSDLIAANSRQIELNINSYLERMKTISTLLFSDETYYLYDATDESMEEYDKVKTEEAIKNRIVDIGLMENYSDFGIIYADDHKVGWISHGTQDLFPDGGMYDTFSTYIKETKNNDGWCFGVRGSTDRMYYIKRLNENAILVSASYTRELSNVFVYPEQLEEMKILFADENQTIIFSSDAEEIGSKLSEETLEALNDNENAEEKLIINSNRCNNGWEVICSVPTEMILEENINLRKFTLTVSVSMAVLFVFVGLVFILRLSRPMDGMVSSLQQMATIDKLSGVRNKGTFQEAVTKRISDPAGKRVIVFSMMDVDNFKQVNDRLGHAYGDQVIIREGKLFKRLYENDTIIGRLGGDEFAMFAECVDVEKEDVVTAAKEQTEYVLSEFLKEFKKERDKCGISLSAGVYVCECESGDFKEFYEKADAALYKAKNAGKNCYEITVE